MKKMLSLLLALLLVLSLCACGSARPASPSAAGVYEAPAAKADTAMEFAAEEAADLGGFSAAAGVSAANGAAGDPSGPPQADPDKIIYSADVTVETTAFDDAVSRVEALVKTHGGWIESSSVNGANYYDTARGYARSRSASYTLRIPSDRFSQLMGELSTLGNVPFSHTYTENVTAQYYDVQARLTAYEAQEQRLLEMMELAETVEDIIILEDRLTEVRYQIERLQTSLNNWDRQVSYSTVYLDLSEVQEYTPEPQVQPSFGQKLLSALQNGLHGLGVFFSFLLFGLAEMLPALLLILVLALIPLLILRKKWKKRKARKAEPLPPEEKPEEKKEEQK